MKPLNEYRIGDVVNFSKGYEAKCSGRFLDHEDTTKPIFGGIGPMVRDKHPTPSFGPGMGYVIGIRMAIMDDYTFVKAKESQSFEEPYPDYVPARAHGKKERCLLLVKGIKGKDNNPFLVRLQNIITP